MVKKILSVNIIVCFFLTSLGPIPKAHADSILNLPAPGTMVNLSPAYEPVLIKGLTVHKDNPFLFDFIVDIGQDRMSGEPLKQESEKLIKYFLASLAIPDQDTWVNLSPYEKSRMIPEALGKTDMGRDLLEQDYVLKQITASLIYPEKQLGKNFWNTVYSKAQQEYGTTQIPVNTFNKVWIMADKAEVFEHNQTAFVVGSHLKVMLEEDYLALKNHTVIRNNTDSIGSKIVRQIILPELEKEVNTGKNFANLRQIFNSIILSSWYKKSLKQALLNQVYANKAQIKGIDLSDPTVKEQIYQQYLQAYKKGVFNYIKEDKIPNSFDSNTGGQQTIARKYFSGGINEGVATADRETVITDLAMGASKMAAENWFGPVDETVGLNTNYSSPTQAGNPDEAMLAFRNDAKVGDVSVAYNDVLNPKVLEILSHTAPLSEKLAELRAERDALYVERQTKHEKIGFLPEEKPDGTDTLIPGTNITVKDARKGNFDGDAVPHDLQRQWIQLTGPAAKSPQDIKESLTDREVLKTQLRNIFYALTSGADGMMFDGEDALGQLDTMSLDNVRALVEAYKKTPLFWEAAEEVANDTIKKGKKLPANWKELIETNFTTRIYRVRGMHLDDRHINFTNSAGKTMAVSATIVDMVTYLVNAGPVLIEQGSTPTLYLPKLQTAEEAAWMASIIDSIEDQMGWKRGTVKVFVLIEQLEEAFQLMEIRAALGKHFVGFNTGRWDYIADVVKQNMWDNNFVPPNFKEMTMDYPFMANYEDRVVRAVNTPDKNGNTVLWIGGMEPQIPVVKGTISEENKEKAIKNAMQIAKESKLKELEGNGINRFGGASGTWVAHPGMVEELRKVYETNLFDKTGKVNQLNRKVESLEYTPEAAAKLTELKSGSRTIAEARFLISVAIQYANAYLTGRAAAALKGADFFTDPTKLFIMEDMATGEGRSKLTMKWMKANAPITEVTDEDRQLLGIDTGARFTPALIRTLIEQEYAKLQKAPDDIVLPSSKIQELPISNMVVEKFLLSETPIPLPWLIDLTNMALGAKSLEEATANVDHYIEAFNQSGGLIRITSNPSFADAAMTTATALKPTITAARSVINEALQYVNKFLIGNKPDPLKGKGIFSNLSLLRQWIGTPVEDITPKEGAVKGEVGNLDTGDVFILESFQDIINQEGIKLQGISELSKAKEMVGEFLKTGTPSADINEYFSDAAMIAQSSIAERTKIEIDERARIRKAGIFRKYVNTPKAIAELQAPIQTIYKVTQHVGQKFTSYMRQDFRNGGTTGTYGVTNQVEAEALVRSGKVMKNIKVTDQHLLEILGLSSPKSEIEKLRTDLKANDYLDENDILTAKFLTLHPKDMKLNETYSVSKIAIYQGLRQIFWKRVKAIYQGGWAEIMKYYGASDQAKAPTTYLSTEPIEISNFLMMHAKHQEAAISNMNLNPEDEEIYRASDKMVDFYLPILMDIDHGHGQPQQMIHVNLSTGRDGLMVASVHLEDQMIKKCGHMSRKSLVTTQDWIEAITAVRQQLDIMGLHDVTITYRTDAEAADVITGDNDGRDQEFLLGLTNFASNRDNLAKTREEAIATFRKKTEDSKSKLTPDKIDEKVKEYTTAYDNMVAMMLDKNGDLIVYEKAINKAFDKGVSGEQLEAVDALWKKLAGVVRLDKLIEQTLKEQGAEAKMTPADWRAFLQTIPREARTDYLGAVKSKAEELGIHILTYDGFQALKKHAPEVLEKGVFLLWDHKATKVHEQRSDFYMIESGLPMAISRNKSAMPYADYAWMEQKNAFTLEVMLWAMALDQGAVDLLMKENYWGLLEEKGAEFKKENGEKIVSILRQYLIQRRLDAGNAFLRDRDELVKLNLSVETAIDLINAVSRPKANNTSPSFRWPFAEIGIKSTKLQSIIDDITKFSPSFQYVAKNPADVQKIWDDTFKSAGLTPEPVLDVKRKMTDKERENFQTVQGRDSQFQFSTYFGEVKNHVLSQLFLQGYGEEEAAVELEKILKQIFQGGFLTDEMQPISKLQELGYGIKNAFTANSQTFAGVIYDAMVTETGIGGGTLMRAFGGASDTQKEGVREGQIRQRQLDLEAFVEGTQKKLESLDTAKELGALIIDLQSQRIEVAASVDDLSRALESLGDDKANKDKKETFNDELQAANEKVRALRLLIEEAVDKIMPLEGAEEIAIPLDKSSLDLIALHFNDPNDKNVIKRDRYLLLAGERYASQNPQADKNRIKELIEQSKDFAMFTPDLQQPAATLHNDKAMTNGGIDLNTSNGMQWKVTKDGQGVVMNIDPAMLARIKEHGIDSLSPVIFKITPIASVWPLVGLQAPNVIKASV